MKVSTEHYQGKWGVVVKQNSQEFFFAQSAEANEEETRWYAKMFRKALKNYKEEILRTK
jgi:hypothetical protein